MAKKKTTIKKAAKKIPAKKVATKKMATKVKPTKVKPKKAAKKKAGTNTEPSVVEKLNKASVARSDTANNDDKKGALVAFSIDDVEALVNSGSSDKCFGRKTILKPPALSYVYIDCNYQVSTEELPDNVQKLSKI